MVPSFSFFDENFEKNENFWKNEEFSKNYLWIRGVKNTHKKCVLMKKMKGLGVKNWEVTRREGLLWTLLKEEFRRSGDLRTIGAGGFVVIVDRKSNFCKNCTLTFQTGSSRHCSRLWRIEWTKFRLNPILLS